MNLLAKWYSGDGMLDICFIRSDDGYRFKVKRKIARYCFCVQMYHIADINVREVGSMSFEEVYDMLGLNNDDCSLMHDHTREIVDRLLLKIFLEICESRFLRRLFRIFKRQGSEEYYLGINHRACQEPNVGGFFKILRDLAPVKNHTVKFGSLIGRGFLLPTEWLTPAAERTIRLCLDRSWY